MLREIDVAHAFFPADGKGEMGEMPVRDFTPHFTQPTPEAALAYSSGVIR